MILQARKHVDKVIVVDDGSDDKTIKIARRAGALIVTHKINKGYGATLRTCFETARKLDADAMVILDAGGQHDPDDIPLVLSPVTARKADIVIGSRFIHKGQNNITNYRKIGIMILNFVLGLVGPKVSDCQSGFRAYSRRAIFTIIPAESGMGASCEILIKAHEYRLKIVEAPVSCNYDVMGSTLNPIFHGLEVLLSLVKSAALTNYDTH